MDKTRRKNKHAENKDDPFKPSSHELEIVKYVHQNVPSFDGKMAGCRVCYFSGQDAVDTLMKSPWAKVQLKSKDVKQIHFTTQDSIIKFMDKLLQKNLFCKAIKVKRKPLTKRKEEEKKNLKAKKIPETKDGETTPVVDSSEKNTAKEDSPCKTTSKMKKSTPPQVVEEKWYSSLFTSAPAAKKPARLEHSQEQVFSLTSDHQTVDEEVVYVWVYEPPPSLKAWLMGLGLILVVIGCCFFPIWPEPLRLGAYYLTLAALSFLAFLVILAILRLSLYVIVFTCSLGRLHWWLFPNLFADCGFFDSFRPLYRLDRASKKEKKKREDGISSSTDVVNQKTEKQE